LSHQKTLLQHFLFVFASFVKRWVYGMGWVCNTLVQLVKKEKNWMDAVAKISSQEEGSGRS
jgi:hypothetical protein